MNHKRKRQKVNKHVRKNLDTRRSKADAIEKEHKHHDPR